jgi:hypothetical protein
MRAYQLALTILVLTHVSTLQAVRRLPGMPKAQPIQFTVLGEIAPVAATSFGLNEHVFLVEITNSVQQKFLAKLSYRYLEYEEDFPEELVRTDLLHHFRALREHYYDENFSSMTTRVVFDDRNPGNFVKVSEAYSTAVAGISSAKPGIIGRRQNPGTVTMAYGLPYTWTDSFGATRVFEFPQTEYLGGMVAAGDEFADDASGYHMYGRITPRLPYMQKTEHRSILLFSIPMEIPLPRMQTGI